MSLAIYASEFNKNTPVIKQKRRLWVQNRNMLVDFVADITCPWCFIGIKRLKQAIALRPDYTVELIWRPFLLSPELHDGSMDKLQHLEYMLGNETSINKFQKSILSIGKTVGIEFNTKAAHSTPSSINAHSVILLAARHDLTVTMAEAIYDAYFVQAIDISDPEILVDIAVRIGLAEGDVRSVLNDEDRFDSILNENAFIHRIGLNGIPSFLFAGKNMISGAQSSETLLHMIDLMATLSNNRTV